MKPDSILKHCIAACLFIFILSCHKRKDFEVNCKILRIAYTDPAFPNDPYQSYHGLFEYTSWGDPSKITWSTTATGRPNYTFRYDNKKRLKEFIGTYDNSFDTYTKYTWGANNMIVADTMYYLGGDVNDPAGSALGYILNYYTYDNKGRVIRIDSQNQPGGQTFNTVYDYDANGNRVRDLAAYDNKKNYLRTNLVLMFVTRDYSVNNYLVADAYNQKGLPLEFTPNIHFINTAIDEIDYNCDHH